MRLRLPAEFAVTAELAINPTAIFSERARRGGLVAAVAVAPACDSVRRRDQDPRPRSPRSVSHIRHYPTLSALFMAWSPGTPPAGFVRRITREPRMLF
jgi:hypothetical protein